MPHSPTNMKVWGGTLWPRNTKINWGLRNIPWADGWSVGSRYSHNLPGLRFQESPADDKNDFFFSAICTGIHGTKYNCVLQWMLVHSDPKRDAIASLTKGWSWTDFCVQLTLGIYPEPVWNKEATQNGFGPCGKGGHPEWVRSLWEPVSRKRGMASPTTALMHHKSTAILPWGKTASPSATIWTLFEETN